MASYAEKRKKGFIDVSGLLIGIDKEGMYRYCVENRLILTNCYDTVEDILYEKGNKPVVVKDIGVLGKGYDAEYNTFRIGVKRGIIFIDGEVSEQITAFIEREKEYRKKLMKVSREAKALNGGYLGGTVPYGYYLKDRKIYVDDYESFVVKFVFYRYSQGCTTSGIAKELNLRGFKNRSGNPFSAGSIDSILGNKRTYQGYKTYKGKEVRGNFRGILEDTEELLTMEWKNRVFDEATEARIAEHRKKYHSENSIPNAIKPYILKVEDRGKKRRRDV